MRHNLKFFALGLTGLLLAGAAPLPDYVASAVNAPVRHADKIKDASRHGAEIVAFMGLKPGQKVADFLPGRGYWTRIFSGVVGQQGHVFDIWPSLMVTPGSKFEKTMTALSHQSGITNVTALQVHLPSLNLPEPVDVFFTSQNLHDLPTPFLGNTDITAFSKQVFAALKPGGKFVVIDHVAVAGAGLTQTDTLHRIEPDTARKAILAAGFTFAGESSLLANPQDNHHLKVFDSKIRGKTDQFIYVFVKPE
ncbi:MULTISPECIES: class I SAM-dependent methyltransferase [Acetobacter]|uniref:Class I SAM-dependent methyltransferase n=1 Tax=Acetobacter thailandicus TaxID=1502842 RepID=A0ABT3QDV9_9PROT|nr:MULTISPECIES: class I SAM-dependent methyltransferase [Acetobacter]MCX2563476.1 class I SAM-dependent methyltransferase [Acetobacter thailandicus]NHN94229.1 methyltransferase [Acetobacter thailandicus]